MISRTEIISTLEQCDSVVFAYLFGSYAKGNVTYKSDVDIAVYMKDEFNNFDSKLQLHHQLQKKFGCEVDLIILNKVKNFDLLEDIFREGFVIKDSDNDQRVMFELYKEHEILDYKVFKKSIDAA